MSQAFSGFYRASEGKIGAISEREKHCRSSSAPAPTIFVVRSTPLRSWSGACSEERPLRSRSCPSLFCFWRISLCIRSNFDSDGWATRIIHFRLFVFSTVSITLIRQEANSLAIRNYSSRHTVEGRLTFRDISSVVIRAKRVNLMHRLCTKFTHQRNRTLSWFREDRRSIFLTTADTWDRKRRLWQSSISFS